MLIGLVGKPSSGKSSIFSALTMVDVARANYPFTTINPNMGVGFVRVDCVDKEFNTQCNPRSGFCLNHVRFVPVDLIDVAGLVPGAHLGKGLGNKFLDDLRKADVLIHVVDASGMTNEKGEMVGENGHDPLVDVSFLEEEIELWMLGIVDKNWSKFSKTPFSGKQQMIDLLSKNLSGLGISPEFISRSLSEAKLSEKKLSDWNEEDKIGFVRVVRRMSKPIVIAANKMDLPHSLENVERIRASFPHVPIFPCSAEAELSLKKAAKKNLVEYVQGSSHFVIKGGLDDSQRKALEYIQSTVFNKMNGTGVQDVLDKTVFDVLKFIAVFPGGTKGLADRDGNIIPDCFLMPPQSTTLDFAFKLHTDFGKNFIKAVNVKTRQLVGKDHVLSHRDVIEIISGKA